MVPSPSSDTVRRRRLAALAIAAVVVLALAGFGAQRWRGVAVTVAPVARADLVESVVATGRVVNPHRVEIGSQVTGTVVAVPVREGQEVRRGDLLVELDAAEAQAVVRQSEFALAQARTRLSQLQRVQSPLAEQTLAQATATLDTARRQFERTRELKEKGFIGQAQLDESQKSVDLAQAQWRMAAKQAENQRPTGDETRLAQLAEHSAQASLDAARARLAYLRIAAPVDGTLISRNVERGDIVQPGRILMGLSPAGVTQLVVQIDERNLGKLALGARARAAADAFADRPFDAEISYVNPAVDPQRGSVEVKLDVLGTPPSFLRQDMTVSVDIAVARRDRALTVPHAAVHEIDGTRAVVYRLADGQARRQPVKLGLRGAGVIEIVEGLAENDPVIVGDALADGQRAHAQAATAAQAAPARP